MSLVKQITAKDVEIATLQTDLHGAREENQTLINRVNELSSEPEMDSRAERIVMLMAQTNNRFHKHDLASRLDAHPTEIDYSFKPPY